MASFQQVKSTPLVCRGHTRPITGLQFSPLEADGQHFLLVSSCKDGTPMIRDGATGDWLGSFLGHKGCCWSIKVSANTQRAISGSADFSAKLWDATDGTCLLTLPHDHIVRSADLSADGSKAITGGHEKKLRLWDLESLLSETSPITSSSSGCREFKRDNGTNAHDSTIKSVIWDERNSQIISAGEDKSIRFWDIESGKCLHELVVTAPITSLERVQDERNTTALTYGNTVEFIDAKTRETYVKHELSYPVSSASIHPHWHDRFVTGSTVDGWVRVHDASTGEEKEVYKGHHGPVHAISYSPDGELYASGSEDGTIRLWQTTPKTYGLWRYEP